MKDINKLLACGFVLFFGNAILTIILFCNCAAKIQQPLESITFRDHYNTEHIELDYDQVCAIAAFQQHRGMSESELRLLYTVKREGLAIENYRDNPIVLSLYKSGLIRGVDGVFRLTEQGQEVTKDITIKNDK